MTDATTAPATGRVLLVGGGPGDPALLTVAGRDALAAADVVVTDRLGPVSALDEIAPQAEIVHVGKIPRGDFTPQERINELLVEHARAGRTVVRLKGGDGYLFGRGGEEWNHCVAAGVPVEAVPGVSSAFSVPALAGIPVTHRGLSQGVAVVSGHVGPDDPRSEVDWAALATSRLTIVVLMGVATLGSIAEALVAAGLSPETPAACIADGATPRQRSVRAPLSQIAAVADSEGIAPPAITIIGDVVDSLQDPASS
ncbi:uroporphyrinogen-III C-methyltransferase [Janibacter hoylei]|uniref:uroporphyrinogen-III C-methyltransferase n=1 Tax=Janibacter hoylei TaxID=364298 RepID=UPI002491DE3D|nr:uroporphyrinogen-III C-methyltransferase [Janibacter hoylei]